MRLLQALPSITELFALLYDIYSAFDFISPKMNSDCNGKNAKSMTGKQTNEEANVTLNITECYSSFDDTGLADLSFSFSSRIYGLTVFLMWL